MKKEQCPVCGKMSLMKILYPMEDMEGMIATKKCSRCPYIHKISKEKYEKGK